MMLKREAGSARQRRPFNADRFFDMALGVAMTVVVVVELLLAVVFIGMLYAKCTHADPAPAMPLRVDPPDRPAEARIDTENAILVLWTRHAPGRDYFDTTLDYADYRVPEHVHRVVIGCEPSIGFCGFYDYDNPPTNVLRDVR